jgi:hypothetical protein
MFDPERTIGCADIEPHLPADMRGRTRVEDRRVIGGIRARDPLAADADVTPPRGLGRTIAPSERSASRSPSRGSGSTASERLRFPGNHALAAT